MKLFLNILAAVFLALAGAAFAQAECEHKIIVLPKLDSKSSAMNPGPVALSQFMIASYLDRFPALPVFTDTVEDDLNGLDVRDPAAAEGPLPFHIEDYAKAFPSGIPASFEALNGDQKRYLIEAGGDIASLMSGKIDRLYSAINRRASGKSVETERAILNEVNNYFKVNDDVRTVILVVNSGLALERHDDIFPSGCLVSPKELKDLTSSASAR